MQLTEEQHAIIRAPQRHCLITAVAGSGKTTTLAHRILHLLKQGQDPRRILVLMFNRLAKQEFEQKLAQLANDPKVLLPEVRTYHAMGLRLYKRFVADGHLLAYQEPILSEQEINFQLFQLLKQHGPKDIQGDLKRNKKDYIELAATLLDLNKTSLVSVQETFEELGYQSKHAFLMDIVERFEAWRRHHRRIGFADMLYEPVTCLESSPELQRLVANKMDLLLVDEYQDTNEIQHLLLKHIAGERAQVTVVGDPDQTIYEFRGARPEFLLSRFAEDFPSPLALSLSYSFRYGHRLALLANHLISYNSERKDVLCRAHPSTPATLIHLQLSQNDNTEVVSTLEKLIANGRQQQDIVVVFRVWSQAVGVELSLLAAGVSYRIDPAKGALATREVSQVLALLELASGRILEYPEPDRIQFFSLLLRFPHVGLNEDRLRELANLLARQSGGWTDALLAWMPADLHAVQKKKLRVVASAWQHLKANARADRLLQSYADDSALYSALTDLALTHEVAEERIAHVMAMARYLTTLNGTPIEVLEHFDQLRQRANAQTSNHGVLLTSIHQTKGLEWPVVMLIGLNDQYLPYSMRNQDNFFTHLESERRLFYVALTRAKETLYLFGPQSQDGLEEKELQPSRFLPNLHWRCSETTGDFLESIKCNTVGTKPSFLSPLPLSSIGRRYLDIHGISYLSPAPKQAAMPTMGPVWQAEKVRHALLGPGKVVADLGDAFSVRFDDGNLLNFSKKSAHLYFAEL